ncbi:FtsB family cell division protein [Ruania alba]|nr:septum formation initiator family protein [Ruania alba]
MGSATQRLAPGVPGESAQRGRPWGRGCPTTSLTAHPCARVVDPEQGSHGHEDRPGEGPHRRWQDRRQQGSGRQHGHWSGRGWSVHPTQVHGGAAGKAAAGKTVPRTTSGRAPGRAATRSGASRSAPRSASSRPAPKSVRPQSKPQPKPSATRRSATARRGGATREEATEPRQITVRGLVLFVVILMAFIVLAPTLRAYVTQQEEQRDLAAQIVAARDRNAELQAQIDQWEDPVYVQARARDRLGFVMPGETPYRVVDPETVTGEEPASAADDQGPVSVPPTGPWYLTVWDSVQVAGEIED